MVGLGESLFAAYALALGSGEAVAGLVATVPMLTGAGLQLVAPRGVAWLGSQQKWVVGASALQAVSLLLMPLAAFATGSLATLWVFVAATLYHAGVMSGGPVWNTWIDGIIPRRVRTHFLACRSRVAQFCTMLGFLIGGLALQAAASRGQVMYGPGSYGSLMRAMPMISSSAATVLTTFCAIFLVAAFCRFASVFFLTQHREQRPVKPEFYGVSPRKLFGRDGKQLGGRIVLYLLAMQVAVQISGPFFGPFLLGEQKISYISFMTLMAISFLGKVIALPLWGRIARNAGPRRLMWLGGAAIVPISGLWIFAPLFSRLQVAFPLSAAGAENFVLAAETIYISAIQLLSGIAWAGYELAMVLMFLEAIPKRERTSVLTVYNFGNAAAMVLGGLIGGTLLRILGEDYFAYMVLFGLSSVMRGTTLVCLSRASLAEETRAGEPTVDMPKLRLHLPDEAPHPVRRPDPAPFPAASLETQQAAG
jgi:MFS family permease